VKVIAQIEAPVNPESSADAKIENGGFESPGVGANPERAKGGTEGGATAKT
jgi:hypothetical protein